jgi:hypothetical protein
MTPEEFVETYTSWQYRPELLSELRKLLAEEREACAKVLDAVADAEDWEIADDYSHLGPKAVAARLAAAIRARE